MRPATEADRRWAFEVMADGMADVVRPWFGWDPDDQWSRFKFFPHKAHILVADGREIGWMSGEIRDNGDRRIDSFYLADFARGKGFGTAIMKQFDAEADAAGTSIWLDVVKNNEAHRMYERLGFRVWAEGDYKWLLVRRPGWTGRLEPGPDLAPTPEQISAVATHYALEGDIIELPATGVANRIYRIGEYILRVARRTETGLLDTHTDAQAVPPVVAKGVLTPELLAFDSTCEIAPTPYTLFRRVEGKNARDARAGDAVWAAVGAQLSKLHHEVVFVPDGARWLDEPGLEDPLPLLHRAGDFADTARRWLTELPTEAPHRRFLHNDLHDANLLAQDGRLSAILDWGDAGWGDPALDFEPMPIAANIPAVAAYRRARDPDDDELEGRILRAQLTAALMRIDRPKPRRVPTQQLDELLAFLRSSPPEPWARWLP